MTLLITFNDIFTQDFLEQFSQSDLSIPMVIFNTVLSFLLGLIILLTYKKSYQTAVYNKSFALGLPIIAMVTAVIILSVSTNIILSLGMVGALSIIRFRTAIKNPFDTVFMFWAIGVGISIGAGLPVVAIFTTLLIAGIIYLLLQLEINTQSYFLIVRGTNELNQPEIEAIIKTLYKRYSFKNITSDQTQCDITYEIRMETYSDELLDAIKKLPHTKQVILLSSSGDYIAE